jgi:hypothetical protein
MVSYLMKTVGLPKDLCDFFLDMNLSYPREDTIDETKGIDESASLEKAELDSLNLLRMDKSRPYEVTGKYLKNGEYTGKLLRKYFEVAKSNTDSVLSQGGYIDGMTLLKREI